VVFWGITQIGFGTYSISRGTQVATLVFFEKKTGVHKFLSELCLREGAFFLPAARLTHGPRLSENQNIKKRIALQRQGGSENARSAISFIEFHCNKMERATHLLSPFYRRPFVNRKSRTVFRGLFGIQLALSLPLFRVRATNTQVSARLRSIKLFKIIHHQRWRTIGLQNEA